jgi:photosystem II stability/assembly factor-like uncharacterized protein
MRFLVLFLLSLVHFILSAQPQSTPAENRSTKDQRYTIHKGSMLYHLDIPNIGPTIFNGRVTDLDVNPDDPTEFFVAYASGGLWYTNNNGTTFDPLFQHESVMTIGNIAVDWKSGTVYLGSGEVNSSRSSYSGNGMYKSTDKGKSWQHLGLDETHHIGRIIIHPLDVNTIWVAALGHLYSENPQRGVYLTKDGGKTWQQTLYISANAGAVDLALHPSDPDILYAAVWERSRSAWHFTESGPASGIYKSTDGGMSWTKTASAANGFIEGKGTGRIGVDIAVKDGKTFLYAIVDNNNRRPKDEKDEKKEGLSNEDFKTMNKENFLKIREDDIKKYLESNNFPKKYTASKVMQMVREDKIKVADLASYNDDANSLLFDTPVVGAEVYLSTDEGASWKKTHETYLDDLYYSYGYYFGKIHVDPTMPHKVYIYGVPILKSEDFGRTWKNINGDNQHGDHHALWIHPRRPGYLVNGNDGGVNISYDDGKNWSKCIHPAAGQFYYINVDNNEPYNVYGGTQDNGVWMGSHNYKHGTAWIMDGEYPYKSIMGGDGMQVQIDSRDNQTIYTGYQFGNYFRLNKNRKEIKYITPKHELGDKAYRWNWQTPILLSSFNQDILYMGANKLLRSMNQGNDFTEISPDLTKGGRQGNVPFGTITTIHESPLKFGLIYAGTDDGWVHVSKDGGVSWHNITEGLPQDLWISRVQASAFDEGTVYVCLNGYRNDHFLPYIFMSTNFGSTWQNISTNLPNEPVNVIKEDHRDADILYAGTDHGAYVSFNKGKSWTSLGGAELPNVPVHDMVIQPKAGHLLLGTHGRSIFKTDIKHLKAIKNIVTDSLIVFELPEIKYNKNWGIVPNVYTEPNVPKYRLDIFSSREENATIEVSTKDNQVISRKALQLKKGLVSYDWIPEADASMLTVPEKLSKKGAKSTRNIIDPIPAKAEDGRRYLPVGEYFLTVKGSKTSRIKFAVIERK